MESGRSGKRTWKEYIISEGIMSYNSSEELVNNVVPVGELSGLVQENRLAPHAFHMVFQAD